MGILGIKSKDREVLNHWIAFADSFSLPPAEFYDLVEKELVTRKIPGLELSREEFAEGGVSSSNRLYLRMMRERLAFDACAAPFGTGYFFSCRTVYAPAVVRLWHVLALALSCYLMYSALARFLGTTFAIYALIGLLIAIAQVFRNAIAMGLADLDTALLKIPAVGPVYERLFRKETYFREDTRLMYLETVPRVIEKLAEEVTAHKGVKLVREYERAPVLGELYGRKREGTKTEKD